MSIDWQTTLYDPIYAAVGVAASITPLESGIPVSGLTALDKTAGVAVTLGNIEAQSVLPAAIFRMAELIENELSEQDLDGGTVTFNGKTWKIKSHQLKPSPYGEMDGEVYLFLAELP